MKLGSSERWYLVGALWGDPCFCVSKGVYYVGVYGEKEFCKRFTRSLFKVYGVKGRVYFNRAVGCHVGFVNGKNVGVKEIYYDLNQSGPYGVDSWHVPDILYDQAKICKIKALQGYFDAEGCACYDVKRGDRRVEAESKNKRGLQQIQNLLSSLEICSKLRQDRNWWKIRISRRESIQKFRGNVNFTVDKKRKRLKGMIGSYK